MRCSLNASVLPVSFLRASLVQRFRPVRYVARLLPAFSPVPFRSLLRCAPFARPFRPVRFVSRFVVLLPPSPLSPVACIPVLSHVAFKHVRRPLHFVTRFRRVIYYSVTSFLLFDVLIIKSSSFGFGITLIALVWLKVTLR